MKAKAIVALGSNLENPADQVQEALRVLSESEEINVLQVSSLYLTEPVGYLDQPEFINAVALIETSLDAEPLLMKLHSIEDQFGRVRTFTNAPRVLDLDLIDYNHEVIKKETITLPHPRAHERAFVMVPLAEIAPEYCLANQKSAKEIIGTLDLVGIQKYSA